MSRLLLFFFLLVSCGKKFNVKSNALNVTSQSFSIAGFEQGQSMSIEEGAVIQGTCPHGSLLEITSAMLLSSPTLVYCANGIFSYVVDLKPSLEITEDTFTIVLKDIHGKVLSTQSMDVVAEESGGGATTGAGTTTGSGTTTGAGSTTGGGTTTGAGTTTGGGATTGAGTTTGGGDLNLPIVRATSLTCECNSELNGVCNGYTMKGTCSAAGRVTGSYIANPYWYYSQANVAVFSTTVTADCQPDGTFSVTPQTPAYDIALASKNYNNGALVFSTLGGASAYCGYMNKCGTLTPDNNYYACSLPPSSATNSCSCSLDENTTPECFVGAAPNTVTHTTAYWKLNGSCNAGTENSQSDSESSANTSDSSTVSECGNYSVSGYTVQNANYCHESVSDNCGNSNVGAEVDCSYCGNCPSSASE